jgi:hypothetical protein
MKNLIGFFLFSFLFITIFSYRSYSQDEKHEKYEVKGTKVTGGMLYGSDLTPELKLYKLQDIIDNPSELENKTVALEGTVGDVCKSSGCWIILYDGTNEIRVQTLHKFFLPEECLSSKAIVEGMFKIKEITQEQARHYNDEAKNPKVKSEDIVGPQKIYVIEATGVKVLDKE